jgi:hypothetical protein
MTRSPAAQDGPRLFVGRDTSDEGMDTCRHCWLPHSTHRGQYEHCPIKGPASVEYAAEVGAAWAVRIVERRRASKVGSA